MRAIFYAVLAFLAAPDILACQCGDKPTPTEAMGSALSVFDGTVVRRTPVLARAREETLVVDRYEFIVHHTWIGSGETRRSLLQGFTNCDSSFTVGTRYLVFTHEGFWGAPPNSSICLPTQIVTDTSPALAELGPAYPLSPLIPVDVETRLQTRIRHCRASFLAGAMLTRALFAHPRKAARSSLSYLVSSFLFVTAAAVGAGYCLIRRRFRLLVLGTLPLIALLGLFLVLQGYVFLRSHPLWWYLIDYNPWGV